MRMTNISRCGDRPVSAGGLDAAGRPLSLSPEAAGAPGAAAVVIHAGSVAPLPRPAI